MAVGATASDLGATLSILDGTVSKAKLDGSGATVILRNQGSLTGIAYLELAP